MMQDSDLLDRIFLLPVHPADRYAKLGLQFNPFPKSGTANINVSDLYNLRLVPVDDRVTGEVLKFISDALNPNVIDARDRFLSATITGDYGTGKTQLLLFVKSILGQIATVHKGQKNPYVIYIDNPGVKLSEFIGAIISKIGEEDFKKYLWGKIISRIKATPSYRERLVKFQAAPGLLFPNTDPDPYSDANTISYKQFLNSFSRYISHTKNRKEFEDTVREVLLSILASQTDAGDSVLAEYFYELLSDELNVNKTWEALAAGGIKQLDKKAVEIIRYIVRLIKDQGYTDFFILVDEFEDITRGRLSKQQVDNYVYNLRTLIDEQREWCLLFSMTGEALTQLRRISPPLADRITNRTIRLTKFTKQHATLTVINYLNIAREESSHELRPFHSSGVEKLNEIIDGNPRRFLRACYYLVERASSDLQKDPVIDAEFIADQFSREFA